MSEGQNDQFKLPNRAASRPGQQCDTLKNRLGGRIASGVAALCIAVGLAGNVRADPPACSIPREADIVALSQSWSGLLAAGRLDELAGLYAEDALLLAEGRSEPVRGRAAIRAYLGQLATRHAEVRVDMRSIMTRCGMASEMTASRFQVTGKRKGTRMFIGGRTSTVYAEQGGGWRIVQQSLPTMSVPNRAIGPAVR